MTPALLSFAVSGYLWKSCVPAAFPSRWVQHCYISHVWTQVSLAGFHLFFLFHIFASVAAYLLGSLLHPSFSKTAHRSVRSLWATHIRECLPPRSAENSDYDQKFVYIFEVTGTWRSLSMDSVPPDLMVVQKCLGSSAQTASSSTWGVELRPREVAWLDFPQSQGQKIPLPSFSHTIFNHLYPFQSMTPTFLQHYVRTATEHCLW